MQVSNLGNYHLAGADALIQSNEVAGIVDFGGYQGKDGQIAMGNRRQDLVIIGGCGQAGVSGIAYGHHN
jgi:hypothetical protein